MLDSEIVDYESINEDSYDGLVSLIEASKGVLSLLIASCKPGDFQTQIINRYEAELAPNIPCYRVVLNQKEPSLRAALEQLVKDCPELKRKHASAAITVTGTEALMEFVSKADSNNQSELSRFFGYLQWTREGLREFPYPIVLWVTPNILSRLSLEAPDFWSWRSGVFRFVSPAVQATGVVNQTGEISLLIESERRQTLPLEELLDQVESLEQQAMETPALATLYNRVANAYASLVNTRQPEDYSQEIDRAIHFFDKSLALQRKLNLPQAESDTLLELGDIYRNLGLWERVLDPYQQSLEIARSLKDSLREAAALGRLGNLYQQYPLGDRANNLKRVIASYDETRAQAYLQLIDILLSCPGGEEPQILKANLELLDLGFLQVCEGVATQLAKAGNENGADFLRNLASQLGKFIDMKDEGDGDNSEDENSEEYVNFLLELLQAEQDSKSDITVIYPMLAGRQHLLNHRFAKILQQIAKKLIADENPETIRSILGIIGNLSIHITNFPLGKRANNLEIAIAGYQAALSVYTRDAFPENWAMTQNNLANAYRNRINGSRADNLEQAITSYAAALTVYTRNDFPEDWATTQNNLAVAYSNRILGNKADNIEQAIAFYQNALEVYTRNDFPVNWATTQHNVANAYRNRINGSRADNLEQAIVSYTAVLSVFTRENYPEKWATAQNNLGYAYNDRIRGEKAENIEKAITYYTLALEVYTREAFPEQWAMTQYNLGTAYSDRIKEEKAENIENAIALYTAALEVYTREAFPEQWAMTQHNLGTAYHNRIRGEKAENIEKAIASYNAALTVYSRDAFPQDWAMTQNNLANAYSDRIMGDKSQNMELAKKCYENALTVRTLEAFPQEYTETLFNLGNLD